MRLERQQTRRLQRSLLARLYRWRDVVELARGLGVEEDLSRYPWERCDENNDEVYETFEREDEDYFRESGLGESLFEGEDF